MTELPFSISLRCEGRSWSVLGPDEPEFQDFRIMILRGEEKLARALVAAWNGAKLLLPTAANGKRAPERERWPILSVAEWNEFLQSTDIARLYLPGWFPVCSIIWNPGKPSIFPSFQFAKELCGRYNRFAEIRNGVAA